MLVGAVVDAEDCFVAEFAVVGRVGGLDAWHRLIWRGEIAALEGVLQVSGRPAMGVVSVKRS